MATREDKRLSDKIVCHAAGLDGQSRPIEGVTFQADPGIVQLGNLSQIVNWRAPNDSPVVLGAPRGEGG